MRSRKSIPQQQPPKENISLEMQNKFKILQEEDSGLEKEVSDEEPMEILKEVGKQEIGKEDIEQGEVEEKEEHANEETPMEVDIQKDKGGEEERTMRKLLHEWRYLDERFILEEKKQRYKEAFQKYKEKTGGLAVNNLEQIRMQGEQNLGMGNSGKGGRKRGRRTMSKTIQEVGEMLVNSGRVIPLSEVFQQTPKLLR